MNSPEEYLFEGRYTAQVIDPITHLERIVDTRTGEPVALSVEEIHFLLDSSDETWAQSVIYSNVD